MLTGLKLTDREIYEHSAIDEFSLRKTRTYSNITMEFRKEYFEYLYALINFSSLTYMYPVILISLGYAQPIHLNKWGFSFLDKKLAKIDLHVVKS